MALSDSEPWHCQTVGHGIVGQWAMALSDSGIIRLWAMHCQTVGHGIVKL